MTALALLTGALVTAAWLLARRVPYAPDYAEALAEEYVNSLDT